MESHERNRLAYDGAVAVRKELEHPAWKLAERDAFVESMIAEGCRKLLEIGSGPGTDAIVFRERGLDVVCTDPSPAMVAACRSEGLEAIEMSCQHLEFDDDSFDAAYAMNSLLHVPKSELPRALGEISRVLKPGAGFYMGVWGGRDSEHVWEEDTYDPKRFFSFFTDDALLRVVSAVFEVEIFRTIASPDDRHPDFQSLTLRKRHYPLV